MYKLLIIIILSLVFKSTYAQAPQIKVNDKDSGKVYLNKLKIDVKIVANIAITTMEMEFCNNSKRVLEGELTFPLPNGVAVSRYAIDINGKMREAVPVEKIKGQIAFENTVRKKVDPGLLEKQEGNNYKTRIYPLPSKGCRTIIIAYQQPLIASKKNEIIYNLPLNYKKIIPFYSFNINVFSNDEPETGGRSCNTKIEFEHNRYVFNSHFEQEQFKPMGTIEITIPKLSMDEDIVMQKKDNDYFFLLNDFPEYKIFEKKKPTTINIIWDNSFSGLNRDFKKEISFLKLYCKNLNTGTINFSTLGYFFNTLKIYTITNGNCEELMEDLKLITYDGATNYSKLEIPEAEETLLFTDGLNTYGNVEQVKLSNTPLYTISSSPSANYNQLHYWANKTGGQLINLNVFSESVCLKQISNQIFRLIYARTENEDDEIFPTNSIVNTNIAISGKIKNSNSTLTLGYGYGNEVKFTKTFQLNYKKQQTNDLDIDKIWAQQKINEFDLQYEVFKTSIEELGKKYNLVARNTSLIILDDVADYVKYKITPPQELRTQYDSLINEENEIYENGLKDILEASNSTIFELKEWWKKDFSTHINFKVFNAKNSNPIENVEVTLSGNKFYTNDIGEILLENALNNKINFAKKGYISKEIIIDNFLGVNYEVYLNEEVIKKKEVGYDEITTDSIQVTANYGWYDIENKKSLAFAAPTISFDMEVRLAGRVAGLSINSGSYSYYMASFSLVNLNKNNGSIEIKDIASKKTFIKTLKETSKENRFKKYLQLRENYLQTASFYVEVANFFIKENEKELALQILSNVSELNLEDHETYKMLGYLLKKYEQYDEALIAFKKVLQWRPQEPQSYRDYALALKDKGLYQNALDTLYLCLTKKYNVDLSSNYHGIEETILLEINNLIDLQKTVNKSKIDEALIESFPVDIRVVLNWNMNDSDMDLWIIDPKQEKCFYSNKITRIGGRISDDFTNGYGPEQFLLKKAIRGKYKIMLHYFGDRIQKIAGGCSVMAEIYLNYGKTNEERKIIVIQLENGEDSEGVLVGEFNFE